jgi:hypothetical protein
MHPYFWERMTNEKMREAERLAHMARLQALLQEGARPREGRRLGLQLGRLPMFWLPLPDWMRLCFATSRSQGSDCY